ncbi:hypothetical protein [Hyphomicrobium sp.]|uniref:hypothetical protein n=1 Tax=Hyphomicrobium sp. TaxID=82 RepID=UPI0025C0067A|nr:hypothetical protein [Hyphomicrobium sp.]MCC7254020.1 hypothetical protein [Hyphomicrobium sp.]
MAHVIEFPRRPAPSSPRSATLEQSLDRAVVACLSLGAKFEGIIADLEKSLTILSVALSNSPAGTSRENAQKLRELKEQLGRARRMLETVRNDLASDEKPKRP